MHALLAALQELPDAALAAEDGLAVVDQVGLGLLALFGLLGIWRGLWWQVMRLVGLGIAVLLARALSPKLGPHIESLGEIDTSIAQGISWVVVFVLALVVASLLGRIGKKSLEALKLGLVDRAGGLVAGAATGLVLFSSGLVGVQYFAPEWTSEALDGTYSSAWLQVVTTNAPVLMDQPAADRFQHFLDDARRRGTDLRPDGLAPEEGAAPGGGDAGGDAGSTADGDPHDDRVR